MLFLVRTLSSSTRTASSRDVRISNRRPRAFVNLDKTRENFEAFLHKLRDARDRAKPARPCPMSDFWLIDGDEYVGRLTLATN